MVDKAEAYRRLREQYASDAAGSLRGADDLEDLNYATSFALYKEMPPVWQMSHADRAALLMVLQLTKPKVVVEIGTRYGGSTLTAAEYADKVYTIDVDPKAAARCSFKDNIEVVIGDSKQELPKLLKRIDGFDLAIVDGDHSRHGVLTDANVLVSARPDRQCWVLMHDSFNPECRAGILAVDWRKPWVWQVEIDFTVGELNAGGRPRGMWGGFALAELGPEDRPHPLRINENAQATFHAAKSTIPSEKSTIPSARVPKLLKRGIQKARRIARLRP
jgi:hypothetical protein